MSHSARKILEQALSLPDEQRAELAAELLDSLRPGGPSEARSDEDWIAEVERRARAALAGGPGLSWKQARAQVSEHIARK